MGEEKKEPAEGNGSEENWQQPEIIERGTIEARLFSDEPDPWGP